MQKENFKIVTQEKMNYHGLIVNRGDVIGVSNINRPIAHKWEINNGEIKIYTLVSNVWQEEWIYPPYDNTNFVSFIYYNNYLKDVQLPNFSNDNIIEKYLRIPNQEDETFNIEYSHYRIESNDYFIKRFNDDESHYDSCDPVYVISKEEFMFSFMEHYFLEDENIELIQVLKSGELTEKITTALEIMISNDNKSEVFKLLGMCKYHKDPLPNKDNIAYCISREYTTVVQEDEGENKNE